MKLDSYKDLLHLLRSDFDESCLKDFFQNLAIEPQLLNRTTNQRWGLLEIGVTIYFDLTFDNVWDIEFVGDEQFVTPDGFYKGFHPFRGELPGSVEFGDQPIIVEEKMRMCGWKKISSVLERPPVSVPDDRNEWPRFLAEQKKVRRSVTTRVYKADMIEFSFSFNARAYEGLFALGMRRCMGPRQQRSSK